MKFLSFCEQEFAYGCAKGVWTELSWIFFLVKWPQARHTILLNAKDASLFACGYNISGELGLGNRVNQFTLTKIETLRDVTTCAIGYAHNLAVVNPLTGEGFLFMWGGNSRGQLGLGDTTNRDTPEKLVLPDNQKCIAVACGFLQTLALTADGSIYVWGGGKYGSLGLGDKFDRLRPEKINHPTPFVAIAAGKHFLAVTMDGKLHACGYGLGTGLGDKKERPNFQHVALPHKVVQIACGTYFSLVLLEDNSLYAFGYNYYGQLGLRDYNEKLRPAKINYFGEILSIHGFASHSVAVTKTGVFTWGDNAHGSLGRISTSGDQHTPTKIALGITSSNLFNKRVCNIVETNKSRKFLEFPIPNDQNYPDLKFVTNDRSEILWHNAVVSIRCPSLRPFLSSIEKRGKPAVARSKILDQVEKTTMELLRTFIYTNKVSLSKRPFVEIVSLLRIAKLFGVSALIPLCQAEFLSLMTRDNVMKMLLHFSEILRDGDPGDLVEEINWTIYFLSNQQLLTAFLGTFPTEDLATAVSGPVIQEKSFRGMRRPKNPRDIPIIEPKSISLDLKKLITSGEASDFWLRVVHGSEENNFLVHKCILSKWPYFVQEFVGRGKGASAATHKTAMPLETFGKLLHFLYFPDVEPFSFEDCAWINSSANFYNLTNEKQLLHHCADFVSEGVTGATWKESFRVAFNVGSPELQERALKSVPKADEPWAELVVLSIVIASCFVDGSSRSHRTPALARQTIILCL
jgi:hypothetical protein